MNRWVGLTFSSAAAVPNEMRVGGHARLKVDEGVAAHPLPQPGRRQQAPLCGRIATGEGLPERQPEPVWIADD